MPKENPVEESKSKEPESEVKETTFESPTAEEIKQLCEAPKEGEEKKKE